jgi:hypothetical protein
MLHLDVIYKPPLPELVFKFTLVTALRVVPCEELRLLKPKMRLSVLRVAADISFELTNKERTYWIQAHSKRNNNKKILDNFKYKISQE